jgi:hypothetical protein
VKFHTDLRPTIDPPWTAMEPIRVGVVPAGCGTPDEYVTVELDGRPLARVDAYCGDFSPFTQVVTWGRFVVLGCGRRVHLVDPAARRVLDVECDGYFGHLYPLDEHLLVATASELICLDTHGDTRWRRDDLGIDGVIVDAVTAGVVTGQGEWDPPGGWRPFRLSLADGRPLES